MATTLDDEEALILINDLTLLGDLTENSILSILQERYTEDKIYTWCGDVLVSVNPFKKLPIYDAKYHDDYDIKTLQHDMEPHVFHVATSAYKRLQESTANQVVLVSGESGAGKTENTKYMLQHIMQMCGDTQGDLHNKILQVNPLVEAFGNAKTILNNNSSRFVKYLQLDFSSDECIQGATIKDYMLEKSRVVHQGRGEGNFHIFYSFLAGLPDADRTMLSVQEKGNFRIADRRNRVSWQSDEDSYHQCLEVLDRIGITAEEKENIQALLAAILHLTNVEFLEDGKDAAYVDDEKHLFTVFHLLETSQESLVKALVTKRIRIKGEEGDIETVRSKRSAEGARDSLAKALYERLFGWIIRKINESLHPTCDTSNNVRSIGMLDICGFECLQENSFEQMCINLVNEKIQGYMNQQIFKREREIYEDQGVPLPFVDVHYNNNEDILAMFMNKGLLHLIDEDTNLGQATDTSLVHKLNTKFGGNDHFRKMPGDGTAFAIRHFAREVGYDAKGFLEKNRDALSPEMVECMTKSSNVMVADLFTVSKGDTGTISVTQYNYRASRRRPRKPRVQPEVNLSRSVVSDLKKSHKQRFGSVVISGEENRKPANTVIGYFQQSLRDLILQLDRSEAKFVRCIKPNDRLRADEFDHTMVLEQLQYNGIAEVARVRKQCWPIRRKYSEILTRFKSLSAKSTSLPNVKSATKAIFQEIKVLSSDYVLGKDMVFMKYAAMEHLENELKKLATPTPATPPTPVVVDTNEDVRVPVRSPLGVSLSTIGELSEIESALSSTSDNFPLPQIPPQRERPSVHFQFESEGSVNSTPSSKRRQPTTPIPGMINQATDTHATEPKTVDSGSPQGTSADGSNGGTRISSRNEQLFWNIFQMYDIEKPRKDSFDKMTLKVVKVLVYILLFLFLLVACVGQRVGLMILVSNSPVGQSETGNITHRTVTRKDPYNYAFLAIAILIPYILTSLTSFFKWLFGNYPTPGVLTWITVLLLEALHSFGLSVLISWVLPQYDMILGSFLLSATCIMPSFLMITCTSWTISGDSRFKAGLKKIGDFLAVVCQASVLPILVFLDYFVKLNSIRGNPLDIAATVVAFVLSSLKCWENFVDGNVKELNMDGEVIPRNYNNWIMNKVLKIRFELQEGRHCVYMVSGLLKIIVTCAVMYGVMILHTPNYDILQTNSVIASIFPAFSDLYKYPMRFSATLLVTICGFVAYYTSYTACKLQMQIMSFSIPLLLCAPVTQGLLLLTCYHNDILQDISDYKKTCDDCVNRGCLHYYLGIPWLISLLWISRHVWSPKQGRLEDFDRLFINPYYCGVLTLENLLLNRRRHQESVNYHKGMLRAGDKETPQDHYFIVMPKSTFGHELKTGRDEHSDTTPSDIPFVYACATMWHETRTEMAQLLKSLFRLDKDQALREECAFIRGGNDSRERFNYQAHIFFDDALELNDDDKWQANQFLIQLVQVIDEACSAVHKKYMKVHDPYKVMTTYGAQLIWEMPGGNLLYVHVKDKNKIRHRKRWSQVMYMYYLLGYQLLKDSATEVLAECDESNVLNQDNFSARLNIDVKRKTQNTYILALDGDTDFSPGSVRVLLDKMANEKVAAVCGRIHPIGSGPLVWYQMFEYAIGHWMQKATEHVLGCVLCSPGCFSLFRAAALMDNNVMRRYAILPTAPGHYLQFDQGEDRWLCTLLLQQGYRVDYAAAADAYTYAPEGFNEFFNQRRRWTPSTLANILDLLASSDVTVARNSNISYLYIFYQGAMMLGTVLGPGTVIMMIAGAIGVVFKMDIKLTYGISLIIPACYIIVCFKSSTKVQLAVAGALSALYSFIMMAVIAGTVVTAITISPLHPSVIFTCLLFFMFVFTGFLHWKEINCLKYCLLYFLCIPTGYLLLFIYSLANLNNVSWGTREIPKRKSKREAAEEKKKEEEKKKNEKKKDGFFSRFFFSSTYFQELRRLVDSVKPKTPNNKMTSDEDVVALLRKMNKNIALLARNNTNIADAEEMNENIALLAGNKSNIAPATAAEPPTSCDPSEAEPQISEDLEDKKGEQQFEEEIDHYGKKHWVYDTALGNGSVMHLGQKEEAFWENFVEIYLKPLEKDEQKETQVKASLIELRNNVCFAIILINGLWIAMNFMFQLNEESMAINIEYLNTKIPINIPGLMFIIFFTVLIAIQFVGMILHRWETLLHLISMTRLRMRESDPDRFTSETHDIIKTLNGIEPPPDYDTEEEDDARNDRIRMVVQEGQTARYLAQSRQQTLISTSRKLNSRIPDLRNVILRNGPETLLERSRSTCHRARTPPNMYNDQSVLPGREVRHRFSSFSALAREQGVVLDSPRRQRLNDGGISGVIPGQMGREFARKITYLRSIQNGNLPIQSIEEDTPL